MRTISGVFPSKDVADKARAALEDAGIASGDISIEELDDGKTYRFSILADSQLSDAASAIVEQAGASDVEMADSSAETVEAESVARLRDPAQPVIPTPR